MKAKCLGRGDEKAGCDGVIFGFTIRENMKLAADRTFCAPESSDDAKALADRMQREISQTPVQASESGRAYLSRVLRSAYPCGLASSRTASATGVAASSTSGSRGLPDIDPKSAAQAASEDARRSAIRRNSPWRRSRSVMSCSNVSSCEIEIRS